MSGKMRMKVFLMITGLILIFSGCSEDTAGLLLDGTWHVEENSQLYGTQHYDVHISQIDTVKIEINNFYNVGESSFVTASVSGLEVAIPDQKVEGYIFSGSGEIASDRNTIILNFTANDGAVIDHVIAQYKR